MYLFRLYIKNFRSIKELDLYFGKGKSVIVGRNNAGKSNIIKALDLVLGESSPTYDKSDNLTDDDFYSWKEPVDGHEVTHSENDLFIWCELQREPDEQLNYEDLYRCYGYYICAEIIRWEGRTPIKLPIRFERGKLPSEYDDIFSITEDQNPEKLYINPKQRRQRTLEQELENKYSFAFAFRGHKSDDGRIIKDIRLLYRENENADWIMSFRAAVRCELLQSAIIPSFRDPQSQLRLNSWSWYGKLMRHLTDGHEQDEEFRQALSTVNSVANRIFNDINSTISNSSLNVAFPGTRLSFQFNTENRTDLYKSCLIYVDDGFKSQLTEKGSGIQSAMIIGLFNYYTQKVNTISSALLCIEEPEIYLHPHARRVINNRLDDFLDGNRNQVILTTHSSEFINAKAGDQTIILVQKNGTQTKAQLVKTNEFKHLLIDNNQNEIFFADKVILCEGYDDQIIRCIAEEICPGGLDERNISIVAVGGKDNLSLLARLILKLGIKCFILADFDYLLRDGGDERKKYLNARSHQSILNLGTAFFSQTTIFGEHGGKKFSTIQRFREELKAQYEEQFYTAKTLNEFPKINFEGVLRDLRQNGICILNGEIENYCTDGIFLIPNTVKMSLDKVYELKRRISEGEPISSFFDIHDIAEFITVVFDR